jgi:hypothetical protein
MGQHEDFDKITSGDGADAGRVDCSKGRHGRAKRHNRDDRANSHGGFLK